MTIHFGRPDALEKVSDAVGCYGDKEFESPTRSTIPLMSLLIHNQSVFQDIIARLGMPDRYDLFIEYTVSPPTGKGKASHTDLMLKSDSNCLAIEAKWTEPMYDTVGKWLTKKGGNESNKKKVLEGWLGLLGSHLKKQFVLPDFDESIYQMVHRAASAVATGANPKLAYFIFEPSPDKKSSSTEAICDKLQELWEKLGSPSTLPFSVVEINLKPTSEYVSLQSLPKGESATADTVIAALLSKSALFNFQRFRINTNGKWL